MATVYACDKERESVLVSYISEPILAFGAMKQWSIRGLGPLLKSVRTALIRGLVNEGTLGEISAMILLLKSMDELMDAGLGWRSVQAFLENLALVKKNKIKEVRGMIPKKSKLNFNHFIQWFGNFKHSDLCFLLKRRAASMLQRNQDGADLLIPFFTEDGEEIKYGAILVQVKNCVQASDTKDVGMKLSASYVFKQWDEEEQNIPLIRVVLELGLVRSNKKPKSFPMANSVDLVKVNIKRDQTTPEKKGKAAYIVTSSISKQEKLVFVSRLVKDEEVKFLRLRGIAGVPWMNGDTYDGFTDLLEGPFAPKTMSSWTDRVDLACYWEELSVFDGVDDDPADK
jgi:hypothetical protein